MQQLYRVLGVRPSAGDDDIKAAFRHLAKQLHPDLNPGDAGAERRLRDVIRAYETLSDPPSRIAYDAGLANQRSLRQRRFRARATTMAAAFTLTVCSVSAAVLWRDLHRVLLPTRDQPAWPPGNSSTAKAVSPKAAIESGATEVKVITKFDAEPSPAFAATPHLSSANELVTGTLPQPTSAEAPSPQPHASPELAGGGHGLDPDAPLEMTDVGRAVLSTAAQQVHPSQRIAPSSLVPPAPSQAHDWATYRDARFRFALEYPGDVFAPDAARPNDAKGFLSRDGRARLLISAAPNTSGMTLAKRRRSLMEDTYKDATFDYSPQRSTWFVLSGTLGTEMFYERVTFSCDGRALHGWKLVYPLSERTFYDRIVEEVHRRYRHGNGPGGRCG